MTARRVLWVAERDGKPSAFCTTKAEAELKLVSIRHGDRDGYTDHTYRVVAYVPREREPQDG